MNNDDQNNKQQNSFTSDIGRIEVDRDLCIGAGPCVTFAGQTFQLDNEGKAVVIDPTGNTDDEILTAAMSCPVLAIKVYDKQGNLIYPK